MVPVLHAGTPHRVSLRGFERLALVVRVDLCVVCALPLGTAVGLVSCDLCAGLVLGATHRHQQYPYRS
jgi:hypothetical protein